MKRTLIILLALLMMLSCATVCFASEESKNVLAKYVGEDKWTAAPVSGQEETVAGLPDSTTVTVENAPGGAVKLFVYSIPTSETEAWSWIKSCFDGKGTPVHAFDIYFADENGNRINANGAVVTIDCPHCTTKPTVCSLTTSGTVSELSNNARSVSVTFTTDGSHYYVLTEKSSAPVGDDDHKVEVKEPTGGKVDISDETPNTGDTVTITPKPGTGKVIDKVTVIDKDGKKVEVKDNGDGSYSYEQPDGDVTVEVTFKDKDTDVDNNPPTGDNSHIGLWIALAIITAAMIIFPVFRKRRKQE